LTPMMTDKCEDSPIKKDDLNDLDSI